LDKAAPGIVQRGLGRPCAIASWAHACLDLADDRPADALARLDAMTAGVSGAQPAIQGLATPQVVEAAVLTGQPARAEQALRVFDAWVRGGNSALPVTASGASLAGLTPQQAEISRLVAVGETNKEIARRLVISHRTVDHHLRNIFTALGVRSRVELARRVTSLENQRPR
jgi:DNA-binding NarL/FixJ family response regulator